MTTAVAEGLFQIFLGLASGLAVGCGLVAFLVVLDVIPRLAQISGATDRGPQLEFAVVSGAVFWTWADFFDWDVRGPALLLTMVGLLIGAFVGTVAAALTEVLNVFPIVARRLGMEERLKWLLAAVVSGKVSGSLFEWLLFRLH